MACLSMKIVYCLESCRFSCKSIVLARELHSFYRECSFSHRRECPHHFFFHAIPLQGLCDQLRPSLVLFKSLQKSVRCVALPVWLDSVRAFLS